MGIERVVYGVVFTGGGGTRGIAGTADSNGASSGSDAGGKAGLEGTGVFGGIGGG